MPLMQQQPYMGGGAAPPTGYVGQKTPTRTPTQPVTPVDNMMGGANPPRVGATTPKVGQPQVNNGLDQTMPATPGNPAATATQKLKFSGINPAQQRTGMQTMQDLEKVLGKPLDANQKAYAMNFLNYTDQSGNTMIGGADYNRLMQEAARMMDGEYAAWQDPMDHTAPYPTEGPLNPQPFIQPTYEDAPGYTAPQYQQQQFRAPSWEEVQNDPGYQFRQKEGMGALMASAAARGMLGNGNTLRDISAWNQDLASQEYQNAYDRSANTFGINTDERRFGHNANVEGAQAEYAPRLVTWSARREDGQRAAELSYDRAWQREVYGRDDNYRRNRASEDDYRYRDNRDEMRRRFLAELGQQ